MASASEETIHVHFEGGVEEESHGLDVVLHDDNSRLSIKGKALQLLTHKLMLLTLVHVLDRSMKTFP